LFEVDVILMSLSPSGKIDRLAMESWETESIIFAMSAVHTLEFILMKFENGEFSELLGF
jgi:hypothetical protein